MASRKNIGFRRVNRVWDGGISRIPMMNRQTAFFSRKPGVAMLGTLNSTKSTGPDSILPDAAWQKT